MTLKQIGFNKLIKDFAPEIEVEVCEYGDHFKVLINKTNQYYWNFHDDWNLLMKVVNKIEEMKYPVCILGNCCTIQECIKFDVEKGHWMADFTLETKLLSTYNAVVAFIKWYNKNK